jgi:hypothetical protein
LGVRAVALRVRRRAHTRRHCVVEPARRRSARVLQATSAAGTAGAGCARQGRAHASGRRRRHLLSTAKAAQEARAVFLRLSQQPSSRGAVVEMHPEGGLLLPPSRVEGVVADTTAEVAECTLIVGSTYLERIVVEERFSAAAGAGAPPWLTRLRRRTLRHFFGRAAVQEAPQKAVTAVMAPSSSYGALPLALHACRGRTRRRTELQSASAAPRPISARRPPRSRRRSARTSSTAPRTRRRRRRARAAAARALPFCRRARSR